VWRAVAELPLLLVVAMVVAFLLKSLLAQAFYIPSASMEPQLREGDRVVVSRLSYRLHDPRRGDVVVFDSPEPAAPDDAALPWRVVRELLEGAGVRQPSETELIKRVVALPGETVEARDGLVYVDGRRLVEPYLPEGAGTFDFGAVTVPSDHVFVMGDNRGNSQDSRMFGPVPISSIVGRALFRAWPPGRWAFL
jgi:signal peptidase I